jgi:subtilisin family serine protease
VVNFAKEKNMNLEAFLRAGLNGIALTSALLVASSSAQAQMEELRSPSVQNLDSAERIEGRYIVALKSEPVAAIMSERGIHDFEFAVQVISKDFELHYGGSVDFTYGTAFKGFSIRGLDDDTARAISLDPNVSYVEADRTQRSATVQNPATWGIDRIDQRNLPLSNSYSYFATGWGVRAYVVDSGIKAHAEFQDSDTKKTRLRSNEGYTAIQDGLGTSDCSGHGTHVAATLGGKTYGVAKGVSIFPVRVLDCNGAGTISQILAGLNWVAGNAVKPAVVNFSIGQDARYISSSLQTALSGVLAAGIPIAAAAGNQADNACHYSAPALSPTSDIIAVGNSTSADARNTLLGLPSNWGSCLTLFAPGTSITSADITSATATTEKTGTSMASPHVAGVIAMYLQDNPTATPATVKNAVVSASTRAVITGAAASPNRLLFADLSSSGGTDPAPALPPPAPTGFTAECAVPTGQIYTFSWSGSGDVGAYELWRGSYEAHTQDTTANIIVVGRYGIWKVRACNGSGCSAFSEGIVIDPPDPGAPPSCA